MIVAAAKAGGDVILYETKKPGEGDKLIEKTAYVRPIKEWNWALGASVCVDDVEAEFMSVMQRIVGLNSSIRTIADGDYQASVETESRFIEIGDMTEGVPALRDNSAQAQQLEADGLKSASSELSGRSAELTQIIHRFSTDLKNQAGS